MAAVVAEGQLSRYAGPVRDRCIAVGDTFEALKQLARAVREAWGGKIAGVTGSVGKTTTKEILAALLGAKLRVLKSEGNLNNEYGLPLTLFRLEETHQAAGLEMGMSPRGELVRLELNVPGRRAIANALAALAAASVWGTGAAEAQSVFLSLRAPAMRGELLRFSNGAALINDSYNSSPAALQAMTELLAATPNFRRRILAAGEMRELGTASPGLHREAGQFAAKTGKIDWVIAANCPASRIVERRVG